MGLGDELVEERGVTPVVRVVAIRRAPEAAAEATSTAAVQL